jgi:TRAP-type C4-dicarboxylate transport system permease small subunit
MMVCLALGMGWCALKGRQIVVDMVVGRFSSRVQAIIDSITYVISLGVYVIFTWRIALEAPNMLKIRLVSNVLKIPTYPFYLILAFGCALLSIAIIPLLSKTVAKAVKR